MFLPTTIEELRALGWRRPEVILVTGDAYVDAPHIGVAVVGRVLSAAGYRVAIISQPQGERDIRRLGEPELFWGVTAGCMDSLVANTTALNRPRRADDLTAGGRGGRRPNRAAIVYANLIRSCFKRTRPIVLGGLEASLRRFSHYDYLTDAVRRSILVDARADVLVYGMAERTVVALADALAAGRPITGLRGICYLEAAPPEGFLEMPPHEAVAAEPALLIAVQRLLEENHDHRHGRGLAQRQDTRFLVQNPPPPPLTAAELDAVHALGFERQVHPRDRRAGEVRGLETIRFSIVTHRGCFGGCRFCAIAAHQGREVVSRSRAAVVEEAERLIRLPDFKGYIPDAGGATANMYGMGCRRPASRGPCRRPHCLLPRACSHLALSHGPQLALLEELRRLPGLKRVFVGSGVRHDLVLADRDCGDLYLRELVAHHVSGQLKIAPEHTDPGVLRLMGKPGADTLLAFKARFERLCRSLGRRQYLTCYFMAAHPGCTLADMRTLRSFVDRELGFRPEQVQIFTPTPGTWSTAMYHAGVDPDTGERIFVERGAREKQRQKDALRNPRAPGNRRRPPSTSR